MKTAFAICFFLCVAVSHNSEAATVTIPEISATLGAGAGSGLSASFGPITLTDTDGTYTTSVPVAYSMGAGGQQMGIKVTLENSLKVENSLPKSMDTTLKFQLTVPSALTSPFDTLKNVGIGTLKPFEDYVPGSSDFNAEYTLPTLTKNIATVEDIEISLSDQVADPSAKMALLASGTDAVFTIELTKAKIYPAGVEIPIKMEIYALKADKMAIDGLEECGKNQDSKYLCEDSPASCGTFQAYCTACKTLCSAAESAIEAVVGQEYLVSMTIDVLKQIQDTGKSLPTPITSSNMVACDEDASKTCFLIGSNAGGGSPAPSPGAAASESKPMVMLIGAVAVLLFGAELLRH